MDLGIIYSNEESFGVSAIEAQACGTPLIVSDAPGLVETTLPGKNKTFIPTPRFEPSPFNSSDWRHFL